METQSKKEFLIGMAYLCFVLISFYIFLKYLFPYLLPFLIAAVIAFLVRKPAKILSEKTKIRISIISPILACLFYVLILSIFLLIFYLIFSNISSYTSSITELTTKITDIFSNSKNSLNNYISKLFPEASNEIIEFLNNSFSNIITKATDIISNFLSSFAKKIPTYFFNFLVTLVATCFLAKDLNGLLKFLKSIFPNKFYNNSIKIKNIIYTSVFDMLKGYFILMAITFIELSISFLILKVSHPFLLGFIIAIIDILPVLGTGIILIPWAIISFLSKNYYFGFSILIIYIIITVIRNFLEPKLISGNIGINPLFTLAAMFLGVKFFGVSGLFILPITLIVIIKYYKAELENEKAII